MAEPPPSRIPVSVHRRVSLGPDSAILQQSASINGNATGDAGASSGPRASSPALSKQPPAAKSSGSSRRHSGIPIGLGRRPSLGEKISRDPGDQSELREAYKRTSALYAAGELSPNLMGTDGEPSSPWTPVSGLARLPEMDTPGAFSDASPLPPESIGSVDMPDSRIPRRPSSAAGSSKGGPSRGIPHSNSSYDLRGRAVTPGKEAPNGTGKYGLSRIPQSTVMHAVALHPTPPTSSPLPAESSLRSPFVGSNSPISPGQATLGVGHPASDGRLSPNLRRATGGSAASTRVIDTLQTELQHHRIHAEKIKQDLRTSQRVVEQLTRQNEDLRDTRDRLRGDAKSMDNVLKRRERMLQETLERARTAEAALKELEGSTRAHEQSTKKQIQQMTAQLNDAQISQMKSERECVSLRESVRSLRDVWAREVRSVREELKRAVESDRIEREQVKVKHAAMSRLMESQRTERESIRNLAEDALRQSDETSKAYEERLAGLRAEVEKQAAETKEAQETAQHLATELMHLRRLMRALPREELSAAAAGEPAPAPAPTGAVP